MTSLSSDGSRFLEFFGWLKNKLHFDLPGRTAVAKK